MSFAESHAPALLVELGVDLADPQYAAKLAAAEQALALTLALVESYLDRKLEYLANEVETFMPPPRQRLLLRRYPVQSIAEVVSGTTAVVADCYMTDADAGVVYLNGWAAWPIRVTYSGGYPDDAWPVDLLQVMMELGAAAYPGMLEAGVPVLAGIEPSVRSVSVPDVGSIEYATSGGSAVNVQSYAGLSAVYTSILDRYRAASIIGGA